MRSPPGSPAGSGADPRGEGRRDRQQAEGQTRRRLQRDRAEEAVACRGDDRVDPEEEQAERDRDGTEAHQRGGERGGQLRGGEPETARESGSLDPVPYAA